MAGKTATRCLELLSHSLAFAATSLFLYAVAQHTSSLYTPFNLLAGCVHHRVKGGSRPWCPERLSLFDTPKCGHAV